MGDWEVPPENPFTARPKPAPPSEAAATEGEAVAPVASNATRYQASRAGTSARALTTTATDPEQNVEQGDIRPATKATEWNPSSKGACHGCKKCCRACHRMVVASPTIAAIVTGIVAILTFSVFVFSCVQLSSTPSLGTCSSPCHTFQATLSCTQFGAPGQVRQGHH
jgi:hypothetical protein